MHSSLVSWDFAYFDALVSVDGYVNCIQILFQFMLFVNTLLIMMLILLLDSSLNDFKIDCLTSLHWLIN